MNLKITEKMTVSEIENECDKYSNEYGEHATQEMLEEAIYNIVSQKVDEYDEPEEITTALVESIWEKEFNVLGDLISTTINSHLEELEAY